MHRCMKPPQGLATMWRASWAAVALGALAACTTPPAWELPAAPDQPWTPTGNVWGEAPSHAPTPTALPVPQASHHAAGPVFNVPAVPHLPVLSAHTPYAQGHSLDLPQLIDIAQRENAQTREAWNRAREAALSMGLTDALFLPAMTAHVVAGEQRVRVPVNLPLNLGSTEVNQRLRGTTPFVTLTWLLFDFGERQAMRDGMQYAALAANVLFNATHQKLIRDVTDAYYRYNAARHNAALGRASLQQHEHVLHAVQARWDAGLATKVDLALARQALAQGRLSVVTHEGLERSSYVALMDAMGLPPYTQLAVAAPALSALPSAVEPLTQERIQAVVAQRADIAAAYAAVKAAEAGRRTAAAAFLPKVYMAAGWARNHSNLDVGNLPAVGGQNSATGVVVGISVPLYDGGLRATQHSKAALAQEQAQLHLESLQKTAVREIVLAEQVLQTALQSHDAAQELVQTATVAHDAALESYRVGRVSTVLLTESAIQLHKAQQTEADAQYASVAAAANLAFVMGTMVSAQADWWPQAAAASPAASPGHFPHLSTLDTRNSP